MEAGGPAKTGAVRLFSAATGRVDKRLSDERIRRYAFIGIAPDGKVLYELGDDYWLLDLGSTFAPEQVDVVTAESWPRPAVFFSPR